MYPKVSVWVLPILLVFGLSGCYESTDVTIYEPGVYKGDRDPLLETLRDPAHKQALLERFEMVQTDR